MSDPLPSPHLLVAALELLTPAGAAGVYLEAERGADLLQPRLSRHRGLIHDLDTGVGHTLGHTSSGGQG